jgi:hypothetical protein
LTAFHIVAFLLFDRILIDRSQRPQRKLLGGDAIADGTKDAKNASVDGLLRCVSTITF